MSKNSPLQHKKRKLIDQMFLQILKQILETYRFQMKEVLKILQLHVQMSYLFDFDKIRINLNYYKYVNNIKINCYT